MIEPTLIPVFFSNEIPQHKDLIIDGLYYPQSESIRKTFNHVLFSLCYFTPIDDPHTPFKAVLQYLIDNLPSSDNAKTSQC